MRRCLIMLFIFSLATAVCDVNNFCELNNPENITLWVWNETSNSYLTSYNAYIDIYLYDTMIVNNSEMDLTDQGMVWHTFNNNATGYYTYHIRANYTDGSTLVVNSFEVVDNLPYEVVNNTLDYIEDSESDLYLNIWNYVTRTLSEAGEISIAQKVWDDTINAIRSVTSIPIVQEFTDRWGNIQKVLADPTELNPTARGGGGR